jgi:two-component system chemotaxis response regulator CheB
MGQPTATPQRPFDLIVAAASAGGVQALLTLFSGLPRDFPVPIAVVLHRSARAPNMLVEVLGRRRRTATGSWRSC